MGWPPNRDRNGRWPSQRNALPDEVSNRKKEEKMRPLIVAAILAIAMHGVAHADDQSAMNALLRVGRHAAAYVKNTSIFFEDVGHPVDFIEIANEIGAGRPSH